MRTAAIAAALVAAALVVPAAAVAKEAAAKEVKEGNVCGASGCRTVTDKGLLMALIDRGGATSESPQGPPQAGPFYKVTVVMDAGGQEHSFETSMVPSRDVLRAEDSTWMMLPAAAKRALTEVVGDDLKPYPAVGLIGAAPAPEPAPAAAAEPTGLSLFQGALVVGGLLLLAAAFVMLGRSRPAWLRRRGPGAAPTS